MKYGLGAVRCASQFVMQLLQTVQRSVSHNVNATKDLFVIRMEFVLRGKSATKIMSVSRTKSGTI